jgi:hypothetical protein
MNPPIIDKLLRSREASIRYRTRVLVLGENAAGPAARRMREEVRRSPRARALLADAVLDNVYSKWRGAHWVLASLAELGYPVGDRKLIPLRDRVLDCWLGDWAFAEFAARDVAEAKRKRYAGHGVPKIDGRYRRCASQQANALLSVLRLGLDDGRAAKLAERLRYWQWPDGGWNCDCNATADTSSFYESLLPLRALACHAQTAKSTASARAARRAAEVFLCRKLFKRRHGGQIIRSEFTRLHYPLYWHYDILGGLKAMAEAGFSKEPRCSDALDLLQSKRLKGGGWPAESTYYRLKGRPGSGQELVGWGGVASKKMNEWVTVDALYVLAKAGRL